MTLLGRYRGGSYWEERSKSSKIALLFLASVFAALEVCAQDTLGKPEWEVNAAQQSSEESVAESFLSSPASPTLGDDSISQPQASVEDSSSQNKLQNQPEPALAKRADPPIHKDSNAASEGIADEPAPIFTPTEPAQLVKPTLNLDAQLRDDLEAQYQRMRKRLETDEAFSESLGEEYLSYGLLLKQAGRLDEAQAMFIDSLHLAKVNHGVYSIEQRPLLRELFEVYYLTGKTEQFEDSLKRIIWLEAKYPDQQEAATYDLLLKAGNYFVDLYLFKPIGGEVGLEYLKKANRYFSFAVKRYSDLPLSERLPPYGELALVNLLKSKIEMKFDNRPVAFDRSRQFGGANFEHMNSESFLTESFSQGEFYLKKYLQKAREEESWPDVVQSLLNLGDINLLFFRKAAASQYYRLAWLEAQKLPADHPLVVSFEKPKELPAFNYARKRRVIKRRDKSVHVPLTFDVERTGRVVKVIDKPKGEPRDPVFNRARRAARQLTFRPAFQQGEMVATKKYQHDVRVLIKNKNKNKNAG